MGSPHLSSPPLPSSVHASSTTEHWAPPVGKLGRRCSCASVGNGTRGAHSHEERGPITVGDHDDGFTGPARVFCLFPTYPRVFPRNKCGVQHDGSPYFGTMFLAVTKLRKHFLAVLGASSALGLPQTAGNRRRSGIFARQSGPTRYPHLPTTMPVAGRR